MSPDPADTASIAEWFTRWGGLVAGRQFEAARALFSPDVVGFGTYMDVVEGLDALEARQWRSVWPHIADFRFHPDTLRVFMGQDRCLATAMIIWTSTGFDVVGAPFPRPGRTTAVLERAAVGSPWLGVHTHFSEFPGERTRSHRAPGRGG